MIDELLRKYPLISDQVDECEIRVILRELEKTLDEPGDVVELGCYAGTTSLFLQRMLVAKNPAKKLYLYDSFAGLPEKTAVDQSRAGDQFVAGELSAKKSTLIQNFRKNNLPLPIIKKAWFQDLEANDLPPKISFAFLDGDYYESIRDSLKLIENRLSDGAIIVVDDYDNEALPGAARAVDEWLRKHPRKLRIESSLAILT